MCADVADDVAWAKIAHHMATYETATCLIRVPMCECACVRMCTRVFVCVYVYVRMCV